MTKGEICGINAKLESKLNNEEMKATWLMKLNENYHINICHAI